MAGAASRIPRLAANRSLQWGYVAWLPVPLLGIAYTAWAIEAFRGDELERKIAREGTAIGLGCSMALVLVLGQHQLAGVLAGDTLTLRDIGSVMFVSVLFGSWRARLRYA